jgi:hypothetical protein
VGVVLNTPDTGTAAIPLHSEMLGDYEVDGTLGAMPRLIDCSRE